VGLFQLTPGCRCLSFWGQARARKLAEETLSKAVKRCLGEEPKYGLGSLLCSVVASQSRHGLPVQASSSNRFHAAFLLCRVRLETHIVSGDSRMAICDLAEKIKADAVVVGCYGRSALARIVLGSTSTWLSHHCTRPLVIVRPEA
jgi:nucleotide-binding universal stress UspA family protein